MSSALPQDGYRPAQRARGRKAYLGFEFVNTVSYVFVAGNLLTLLALQVGASRTDIGLIAAFTYVSYLFMPFSKFIVPRLGLVKTFGYAWLGRFCFAGLLIFTPILAMQGRISEALFILLLSNFLFQVMRGLGLVSISPLAQALSAGKDQGEYLSIKSILVSVASLGAGLVLGLCLGDQANYPGYLIFIAIGLALGVTASLIIFRIPEPPGAKEGARAPFFKDLKAEMASRPFRYFMITYGVLIFLTSLGRPFLLVYAKQVYGYGDDLAMVLTVIGSVGVIVMGQLSRLVLDRLGAKPMLVLFTLCFVLSFLPLLFSPVLGGTAGLLFMGILFFASMLGAAGTDNASQAYFFGILKSDRQFNMGMLFYLVTGVAGGVGSYLGGVLLDVFGQVMNHAAGNASVLNLPLLGLPVLPLDMAYRLFFTLVIVVGIVTAVLLTRLESLGSRGVSEALASIFNPRDLMTLNLLRRLDQPLTLQEEQAVLSQLPQLRSDLAVQQMIRRLDSPMYAIRGQALLALERLPLNSQVEDALIHHMESHVFGTAFRAARILGQRGVGKAVPALRASLDSDDRLLRAYAAGALGELGAAPAREELETLVLRDDDFLVLVHGVGALGRIGNHSSLAVLLEVLCRKEPPAYLRDELVFGMAGILGCAEWMYPRYAAFLENESTGIAQLLDAAGEDSDALARLPELIPDPGEWSREFLGYAQDLKGGYAWMTGEDQAVLRLLLGGLEHGAALSYIRFRYFCTAWLVWIRAGKPAL